MDIRDFVDTAPARLNLDTLGSPEEANYVLSMFGRIHKEYPEFFPYLVHMSGVGLSLDGGAEGNRVERDVNEGKRLFGLELLAYLKLSTENTDGET